MASRYWVGGTGTWDASDTSHWSATSGGSSGASVPTSSDTVNFDSNSGTTATVTVNTNPAVASSVTINKSDLSLTLLNTLTVTNAMTLTTGTFNSAGQSFSCASFTDAGSGSTKVVTLGASAFTVTTTFSWSIVGLTWSANTATMTHTNATAGPVPWQTGAINFNGLSVVAPGAGPFYGYISTGGAIVANFTRTGTASKFDSLSFGGQLIVTGTFTATGNSATNRLSYIQNPTVLGYIVAANTSLTNVDFHGLSASGAASWSGTSVGDGGNNSGITFTPSVTRYAVGPGNWDDTAMWSATSTDGATGASVPLCQDDVVLDANTNAGTIATNSVPRLCRNLTCTGFTGTLDFGTWQHLRWRGVYGSIVAGPSMTITGSALIELMGVGNQTITSNGKTWTNGLVTGIGCGTYTLADTYTSSFTYINWFGTIHVQYGTFSDGGFAVTLTGANGVFYQAGGTLNASATWTIAATTAPTPWLVTAGTVNHTGIMVLGGAATITRTFAGGGKTYGTLTYSIANSAGVLAITGANTFNTLNVGSGRILTMPASTTNTVTNFNVNGVVNGYVRLPGVAGNYASAPDSAALSITGDIDIRVRVALDDWTPAASMVLVAKITPSTALAGYMLYVGTDGTLRFAWGNGAAYVATVQSTAATGVTDGAAKWARVTIDVDDGAGNRVVKFWLADGSLANPAVADFTQLGSTSTTAGATTIGDAAQILEIGTDGTGTADPARGGFYRAQIYNGIDGTLAFDADFTTKPVGANSFTESSANAATVTINGVLAQAGDGRVSLVSSTPSTAATISKALGTVNCDYLSIQDSTATGGARYFAGTHSTNVSGNTGWNFIAPTYNTSSTGIIA